MTTAQRRAAIITLIERHTVANTVTRDTARQSLIDEGIYTEDGELTLEFGGEREKEAADA